MNAWSDDALAHGGHWPNHARYQQACDEAFGGLAPASELVPFTADAPTVVCVARDEERRLPAFLAHYRQLGARSLHIVDHAPGAAPLTPALAEALAAWGYQGEARAPTRPMSNCTGPFFNHATTDMTNLLHKLLAVAALCLPLLARAQVPVQGNANHEQLLAGTEPRLASNKRLVYDFWREVFEGGHMELADKYLAESYIQHNPNVPTGRAAFVEFFSRFSKPKPIDARVKAPLVAIVAEGDLVILSFVREAADPKDAAKKYTTTWFDMFRIEGGKIAEHWDAAPRQ